MDQKDIDRILFPHEKMRPIQINFMYDVKNALENGEHVLAHAPTGLGKTSVLGPVLKHALKNKKTVFFLTPMHTQHKIAIDTIRKIKLKYKLSFLATDIIGKRWMCAKPAVQNMTSSEFAEYCRALVERKECEFYTNTKTGIIPSRKAKRTLNDLKNINPKDVEEVCDICRREELCPAEMTSFLAKDSSVIIADYFHLLSKPIRKHFLAKSEKELENAIIIFDEAHNLPSKARELLTDSISTFVTSAASKEARRFGFENVAEVIDSIENSIFNLASDKIQFEENESLISKEEVNALLRHDDDFIEELIMVSDEALENQRRSFCLNVASFLKNWQGDDEGYVRIISKEIGKKSYIKISYKCLDPSFAMKELVRDSQLVLMSGTLSPVSMYSDLLGVKGFMKEYKDPFPKDNRFSVIVPSTTTKYTERNEEMYKKIGILSGEISNSIKGNTFMFFPSYSLMNSVKKYLEPVSEKTIFTEIKGLDKQEKNKMIEKFKNYNDRGALFTATSSGSFGEGIDLPGNFLNGVIVVGLPLSKPDLETKKLIEYYEKRFAKGMEYGYLYPAILRTVQNAGRCIRTSDDKGVIAFIDERYLNRVYYDCFPSDWDIKISKNPIKLIKEFFGRV